MSDTEIIIEVAKLDGWEWVKSLNARTYRWMRGNESLHEWFPHSKPQPNLCLPYTTSRDAIIPVIEKVFKPLKKTEWENFCKILTTGFYKTAGPKNMWFDCLSMCLMFCEPRQLAIALLKATGKWRDE